VFQNVLDNAYQAVREEGGEIMVSACEGGPGRIEIEIADNGVGFEAEEAEKLFEPFYTKKSKGTGLGLAICRELVRLQNGEITIEGRKNQGATVHLLLPRQQQEAGAMSR
jgi:signal transduction histidine kinase